MFRARLSGQNRWSWFGWLWLFLPTAAMALTSVFIQQRALVAFAQPEIPYPAYGLCQPKLGHPVIRGPLASGDGQVDQPVPLV